MHYLVAAFSDDGTSWGIVVPDLPGCFSGGDTLAEALFMAREGIELHVCSMEEDNDPFPELLPLEEHKEDPYLEGAIWGVVPYEDPEGDFSRLQPQVWDPAATPYLILLRPTPDGYVVNVPDVPGCHALGPEVESALVAGQVCIEALLGMMSANGVSIPPQRPFAEHQHNPAYADGLWAVVPVIVPAAAPSVGG